MQNYGTFFIVGEKGFFETEDGRRNDSGRKSRASFSPAPVVSFSSRFFWRSFVRTRYPIWPRIRPKTLCTLARTRAVVPRVIEKLSVHRQSDETQVKKKKEKKKKERPINIEKQETRNISVRDLFLWNAWEAYV